MGSGFVLIAACAFGALDLLLAYNATKTGLLRFRLSTFQRSDSPVLFWLGTSTLFAIGLFLLGFTAIMLVQEPV